MKKFKKIFLAVGLLVMLLALTGCQSSVTGDEVTNVIKEEKETEMIFKLFAREISYGEVQEKDNLNVGYTHLVFYIDNQRIYEHFEEGDWVIENGAGHKEMISQDHSNGIYKFKIKPGTHTLMIKDKRNAVEDFKTRIKVGNKTEIIELDLGILDPPTIDLGDIELEKK